APRRAARAARVRRSIVRRTRPQGDATPQRGIGLRRRGGVAHARIRGRRRSAAPRASHHDANARHHARARRRPLMPVITISRMYGSGGSEIAERVATRLGWPLFDNAMVDAIAERSGLTRAEVTAQDERVPSLVERLAAALSLGSPE